jgi:hypothetical protein
MANADTEHSGSEKAPRRAGAFDIRSFIALLVGIYGVVLVITGLVSTTDQDLAKAGGVNVNLWAGLGMVVVAALMQAWAMWRPVVVPKDPTE